jgi:hypothetical protein
MGITGGAKQRLSAAAQGSRRAPASDESAPKVAADAVCETPVWASSAILLATISGREARPRRTRRQCATSLTVLG